MTNRYRRLIGAVLRAPLDCPSCGSPLPAKLVALIAIVAWLPWLIVVTTAIYLALLLLTLLKALP